jgi:ribosomal protein RSM22 (predicted rRNA methylase)
VNALPDHVQETIEELLYGVSLERLQTFAKKLSDLYTNKIFNQKGLEQLKTKEEHLAYLAFRMPATYAAIGDVFERIVELLPNTQPRSLLDLGAGPGTAYIAANNVFGSIQEATLIERDPMFIELGKKFTPANVNWKQSDLDNLKLGESSFDLTVLSYALGELNQTTVDTVLELSFKKTNELLVLVEPGTPKGYETIIYARDKLLEKGGFIVAPCPHAKTCPIVQGDWCHFSKRLPRSKLHRFIKGATLGYEDEKFSYVVFSRKPVNFKPFDRIIRAPNRSTNHIDLTLCTHEGKYQKKMVSKKDKASFSLAKKASWGDILLSSNEE